MPMGEHNPNLDLDNLHLTAEEAAARAAAQAETNAVDTDVVVAGAALKDAAVAFGSQLKSTVAIANAFIHKSVKDSPALTIGGAAGAGFVLGGGLSAPLTRSLISVGVKAGSAFLLDAALKTLGAMASEVKAGVDTASDSTRDSRRATSSEDTLSSATSINNGETP